ncbi:hypothetical protein PYW07_008379 [Mythimna separata]|uniref:HIT-type domain-containing protein n=1 Tax=Mythimna separata TaxID=271217 RepID=A0AAD8DNX9_MYTSE|nr:hypothetical protein PYW07_008379 [Mythimna separata]
MAESKTSKINQNVCGICEDKQSKYCCPRCEVFYCSLDCYKSEKHQQCSESFYRDCVNDELTSHNADDESRDKMIEILKRMQNEDTDNIDIDNLIEYDDEPADSDDEEEIDLEERIKDLNLDDPDAVWNALTEDERNEFEALLNQGDVGSIMPQWDPWWTYRRDKKLVEDVAVDDSKALENCPELKAVVKFETLTTIKPSPAIKNNITNVLASYAFVMRYFNGEIEPREAVIFLLDICDNLDSNANFDDPAVALESVAQKCLQSNLIETDEASLTVMKKDTFLIIRGPSEENEKYYCQAALSHLHHILSMAKSLGKQEKTDKTKTDFSRKFPDHQSEHLPSLDVSKVKKCLKKVEFYLSYIDSYNMDFE